MSKTYGGEGAAWTSDRVEIGESDGDETLEIEPETRELLVDNGAAVSIIKEHLVNKTKDKIRPQEDLKVTMEHDRIKLNGSVELELFIKPTEFL